MTDDQDDDQARTVEQILAEWRAEGPAIAAEMAERQRKIDAAETLEWARQRNAARAATPAPEMVTRSYAAQAQRQHADVMTKEWAAYIRGELNKRDRVSDRVTAKAVASVILAEERARIADVAALRRTIDELQERISQLEGAPRGLRAV